MTAAGPVLFLCFFLSGASGLIYEVVWLRWLVQLFGATTLAVGTILSAFMGGLAAGSWAAGRLGPRLPRPLAAYGALELVIGLYALLLPGLLQGVVPTLRLVGATETSAYTAVSLGRFGLAAALLVIPTACMGATLPLLAQFVAPHVEGLGGRAGRLYAVNTAGAVLGTAAAGFILLPTVGVTMTNRLAVALNLAVAVTAVLLDRRVGGKAARAGPPSHGPAAAPPLELLPARRAARVALATAAVSGALAMVYEVAWARALALVLGSSVYAFTVMLTTFLIGLAAGSYLAARRVDRLREPGLALAVVQALIGLTAFAGVVVLQELPYLFLRLFAVSGGHHGLLLALEFLLSGGLILLPAVLSGAVFPICVRLTAAAASPVGRTIGTLYAVNTVGAIVGSFVGGFLLIPTVGIRGTLLLAILLNVGSAFALLLSLPTRERVLALWIGAALPIVALAIPALAPDWDAQVMASGVAVYAPRLERYSRHEFLEHRAQARIVFYDEGLTTTVSVEEQSGHRVLRVNGKADASTMVDMPTQVLLAHLPLLLHPDPRDVVVIGLGSGVTAGSTLRHPVRAVTVVELEDAVVRASRYFDEVNGRPLGDPRTRLVVNDARNFMLLTRARFDVIVSEPSNPWMTGAASLFTQDFFELARARLRLGGVFGQWLQIYGLTPETLRTVMATFASVFPYTTVAQVAVGDLVLIGSERPLSLDHPSLLRRTAVPAVAEDLGRSGVRNPVDLVARLLLDVEDVGRFTRGAALNTDDNASVEFNAPRSLYLNATEENLQRLTDAFGGRGSIIDHLLASGPERFATALAERLLQQNEPNRAEAIALAWLQARPDPDLLVVAARAAAAQGAVDEAERRWQAALALDPGHPEALLDLAEARLGGSDPAAARPLLVRAAPRAGPRGLLRAATQLQRLGAYRDAAALLARLPADQSEGALPRGLNRLAVGDAAGAEPLLREALRLREGPEGRAALAASLDQLGRPSEARRERRRALELEEAAGAQLRHQASILARTGHLRWAEYDLRRASDFIPWSREVQEERARLLERMGERRRAIEAWEVLVGRFPGYAPALAQVAALWLAEGEPGPAAEALRRYISAEADPVPRRQAEASLQRLLAGRAPATTSHATGLPGAPARSP